jgi:hypothetical protein
MNDFYVYVYIRSKDSTTAKAGTPYYVGKGKGRRRFESHVVTIPNIKYNVIVFDKLLEMGAFIIERKLIRWYGRKDLGTGILHNRTDGGDGGAGRRDAPETIEKRRISNTGKKRSLKAKKRMSTAQQSIQRTGKKNSFFGKTHTDSTREIMSLAKKGKTYEEIMGTEKATEMRRRRREEQLGRIKGPQATTTCPHCNKTGGQGIMKRWHFDRCKLA